MGRRTLQFNGVTGGSRDPGFPSAARQASSGLPGEAGVSRGRVIPAHPFSAQPQAGGELVSGL